MIAEHTAKKVRAYYVTELPFHRPLRTMAFPGRKAGIRVVLGQNQFHMLNRQSRRTENDGVQRSVLLSINDVLWSVVVRRGPYGLEFGWNVIC